MKRNLAPARAHESAARSWLSGYDPKDGRGIVGPKLDPHDLFSTGCMFDAFEAGAAHATEECSKVHRAEQDDWAIERATGQRQLDEAQRLISEAAALLTGYADHHKARADEAERRGDYEGVRASLQKQKVNLTMALSLREWTPAGPPAGEDAAAGHGNVVAFSGVVSREQAERFGKLFREVETNVRPVTTGPLTDPDVVEGLLAAAGQADATCPLSLAKATAFRLSTPDPRFDPQRPVCVNGFLYTHATEASGKWN